MSQAAITKAFSEWKAQQAINNNPVTLDEFIFAYIPGLDTEKPIDITETTPTADKIVHRQVVSKSGVVNENAVVYSVTLGADIGDFDFNWIGLANKATGTLAMIIHAPTQRKIKNASGQQGNVLVRSMLMEYSGAKTATAITTPAETWQIDFTARLAAMDERQRLENIDLYGEAAFFGSGYLVAKSGTQFYVTKGAGYVAGLRSELLANQNITVTTKPVKVWLDVCWTGTLTSEWAVHSKITVAASLVDYVQNGEKHYVFAVASIDASGNITDLRPKGTLNDQQASDALKKHEQSRNHPDASTTEKGFVQLSSETDSDSEKLAATPKAIQKVNDNANQRLAKNQNGADIPEKDTFVKNIGAARAFSGAVNTGSKGNWTTADFINWLESQGAFNHPYWVCKGSWSYAGNKIIADTKCGNIQLAGAVIEVMGTRSEMTIRITTATTGEGITNAQFIYINHGDSYSPGWRRDYNTINKPDVTFPVGAPIPWPSDTLPPEHAFMHGQSFDKTAYPLLAVAYPSGVIPDMREWTIKGKPASGRAVLSQEQDGIKSHTHSASASSTDLGTKTTSSFDYGTKTASTFDYGTKTTNTTGAHTHTIGYGGSVQSGGYTYGVPRSDQGNASTSSAGNHAHTVGIGAHNHTVGIGAHSHTVAIGAHGHTITVAASGNAENTVKNIAFNYIVRLA